MNIVHPLFRGPLIFVPSSHREEVAELRFEPRSYQTAQPMLSSPIKYPPP